MHKFCRLILNFTLATLCIKISISPRLWYFPLSSWTRFLFHSLSLSISLILNLSLCPFIKQRNAITSLIVILKISLLIYIYKYFIILKRNDTPNDYFCTTTIISIILIEDEMRVCGQEYRTRGMSLDVCIHFTSFYYILPAQTALMSSPLPLFSPFAVCHLLMFYEIYTSRLQFRLRTQGRYNIVTIGQCVYKSDSRWPHIAGNVDRKLIW